MLLDLHLQQNIGLGRGALAIVSFFCQIFTSECRSPVFGNVNGIAGTGTGTICKASL